MKTTTSRRTACPTGTTSLDTYFEEISRYRLLTREEEEVLIGRMRRGDTGAREQLITANLRFVVSQAQKLKGLGLALEDLIAEGNTGLMKAVERFRPGMGASVCTYAIWWIRQRMMRAIENHGRTVRLPSHILDRIRKLHVATAGLTQLLGREPDDWEIAEQLDTPVEKLAALRTACTTMVSLDDHDENEDQPRGTLAAQLGSGDDDPCDSACRSCDQNRARQLLAKLPRRLRLIMERRFGIGNDSPVTLQEVGRELGVTRERTRQLERKALALLRHAAYRMDPRENDALMNQSSEPPARRERHRRTPLRTPQAA